MLSSIRSIAVDSLGLLLYTAQSTLDLIVFRRHCYSNSNSNIYSNSNSNSNSNNNSNINIHSNSNSSSSSNSNSNFYRLQYCSNIYRNSNGPQRTVYVLNVK